MEWGRKLYARTLINQIAMACYKDRVKIEREIRGQFADFKTVASKDFEYGFKIRVRGGRVDSLLGIAKRAYSITSLLSMNAPSLCQRRCILVIIVKPPELVQQQAFGAALTSVSF